jgi:hypothetical protein
LFCVEARTAWELSGRNASATVKSHSGSNPVK